MLFGKRAEGQLQNYLKKGQQVFVSGELSQSEYTGNDGTTRTSLELTANVIDLIGKRNESSQGGATIREQQRSSSQPSNVDTYDAPYDDDIPF